MKALAALAGAAFTVAACYSLGSLMAARLGARLRRAEKFPLAFVLGAAVLHLAVFAVMALKIAYKPVLVLLLAVATAAGILTGDWRLPPADSTAPKLGRVYRYLFGAIAAAFTVLYLFNAWAPEISPDGASYHLGLVARYLRVHGFEPVPTNVLASLSEGVEMLFVPAFAIGRHSAAALVHYAFLIALALAIYAYGRRIGKPLVGAGAALLVYLSPIVGIDGTSAYVDVAAGAIVFAVFYWTQIWDEDGGGRLLAAIGLLAGFCYAAKYTAFVMALYAAGYVVWRTRKLRPVLVVAAFSLVTAAPWAVKDWIYVGNPVAPLGNRLFPNPQIHVDFERELNANVRTYGLKSLWDLPFEVTARGEISQGLIGPVFLAAPLALLALRFRAGRRLLAPFVLLLATYFTNVGARFLIPCLPFLALAMALALEIAGPVIALLAAAHAIASWPTVLPRYTHAWMLQGIPFKAALRIVPEEEYLRRSYEYRWARMIEQYVPPGQRVFVRTGLADAYTSRDVLVGWQGAFNQNLQDLIDIGWDSAAQPSKVWIYSFPEQRLRGIRVVQTGTAQIPEEQWSIHELRFFDAGAELPRRPEWRLRASANPWDIQMAFDNSEATRWRSWETMRPGMAVQVDFGAAQQVDQVRVEIAANDWNVRMGVEAEDERGRWAPLAARTEERRLQPRGSVQRAVAYELRARGVRYLLLRDTDWGAKEIRDDPAKWNMTMLARADGASIYRVNP